MSLENAKAMLEKMKTDKELVEKIKAADNEGKKKIAENLGLSFSADEMKEAIKSNSELSDDDLAAVAGGASGTWVAVGAGAAGAAAACGWQTGICEVTQMTELKGLYPNRYNPFNFDTFL